MIKGKISVQRKKKLWLNPKPVLWIELAAAAKSLQSCPTVCDPIDGSPPGFPSMGFSRQELLPGKSHGRRSLIDYSPWGPKESDTTE